MVLRKEGPNAIFRRRGGRALSLRVAIVGRRLFAHTFHTCSGDARPTASCHPYERSRAVRLQQRRQGKLRRIQPVAQAMRVGNAAAGATWASAMMT